MEVVEQQHFQGDAVDVDNTEFKNCVFENTALVFSGGELPAFVDCEFVSVSLQFTGAAANTLSFLGGLRKGGFATAVNHIVNDIREG